VRDECDTWADDSVGLSGAEIVLVCREAGLLALTEGSSIETVAANDILVTVDNLKQAL
jgi:ATP-dependent 26S proteasome regulatory subunit